MKTLQLPKEEKYRGRYQFLLPGNQRQEVQEEHEAVPGEVQTRYWENILHCEGDQTLYQASY